jgi:hypothetical protein
MAEEESQTWYHIILTTYGSWLSGDPRGFRTRHHRTHVEGDYKNPPPKGAFADWEQFSRRSLKQDAVRLPQELREVMGRALIEKFERQGAFVLAIAVAGQHIHIQVKLPTGQANRFVGSAKRHGWFVLRDHGWKKKLWGKGRKVVTIRDRDHQVRVFYYILDHAKEGAWVWWWSREKDSQRQAVNENPSPDSENP